MAQLNESKLIEREIILRNLSITGEVVETRRAMVRWLALALGVINPGESRLSAVYVLDAMLYFQFQERKDPTVAELSEYISKTWAPINEKTLRYHLLQLQNASIIAHAKSRYYMSLQGVAGKYDPEAWINEYFSKEIDPIKDKVITVIKEIRKR
ncbi:hypothetical protein M1373_03375 [Candidatus Marsarchaeota archaeon]|nr:hypothetical protein [Candidatus Marsarchaeota archaeon]MCL5404786.1 hypothetical protein [Candidatus Marsarchaeota archaeon]